MYETEYRMEMRGSPFIKFLKGYSPKYLKIYVNISLKIISKLFGPKKGTFKE